MKPRVWLTCVAFTLCAGTFTACFDEDAPGVPGPGQTDGTDGTDGADGTDGPGDLADVAAEQGSFNTFLVLLSLTGLDEVLAQEGPFTVFAPTDQAFADAGITRNDFQTDEEIAVLRNILLYHVVDGRVLSSQLTDGMMVTTLNGEAVTIGVSADITVNSATVIAADFQASNGVLHAIDGVLSPPEELGNIPSVAASTGNFNTLLELIVLAGLADVFADGGPFTVFAPTDAAFAAAGISTTNFNTPAEIAALRDILLYHVLDGAVVSDDLTDGMVVTALNGDDVTIGVNGSITVNGALVSTADIMASNGVIHAIEEVLIPPGDEPGTIVEVAEAAGTFDTLIELLVIAGLADTLATGGPFTVFAPTDAAFQDAGIVPSDFDTPAEIAILTQVLLYHVVDGQILASSLSNGMMVNALSGQPLTFGVGANVTVNGVALSATDVMASNGVIHVLGGVLTPPEDPGSIADVADQAGNFKNLVMLLENTGLIGVLDNEGPFTVFAPTDDAFENAGISADDFQTEEELQFATELLLYHVVDGEFRSTDLTTSMIMTLGGFGLSIEVGDVITVNGANIIGADILANNGIIHVIDDVLIPPDVPGNIAEVAADAGNFGVLLELLTKAGLASTIATDGPFTVFAPTDEAFAEAGITADDFNTAEEIATLSEILRYHVIDGEVPSQALANNMALETLVPGERVIVGVGAEVTVDWATVVKPDVMASNGIIHAIDRVLLPGPNIAEVAAQAGNFTTLLALLQKADLAMTIATAGPLTVFAPTNGAFAAAGVFPEDFNTDAEIAVLTDILLYHVLDGQVLAADLVDGQMVPTLGGPMVTIDLTGGPTVNGIFISSTDIMAVNGVVHVIEGVLLPPP